ncbi:MAG: FMN-binding protein [Chitinispirillaceae bacterium]|nr:FMN-binding protein [Chitinispirillaceae bacterium]
MNKKSPLYVIGFMVVISIVFGAAIAAVYNLTADITRQNEVLNRNRTIASAFDLEAAPSASAFEAAVNENINHTTIEGDKRQWELFIRKEAPHDVGFLFKGIGFWDVIAGICVLSPDLSHINNIRFMEQHETPGLGARIEEPWFYQQFSGKAIAWDKETDRRIVIGPGPSDQPNRVDAITGATQTSLALMKMLNRDLDAFRKAYQGQTRMAAVMHPAETKAGETVWP